MLAVKGVPKEEWEEHKKLGGCKRCGQKNHDALDCFARKTTKGIVLPRPANDPFEKSSGKATVATTKRKRSEESEAEVPKPDEKKARVASTEAVQLSRVWEYDSDVDMSDF